MKQEFLKAKTGTIRYQPYLNNRPAVASSATVTLLKADGTTLQAEASATVNGTTGELTYALTTTHTADLGENYVANWKYTVSSVDYYVTQLFDVVLHKLVVTVQDSDLLAEQSDLLDTVEAYAGTADSSSSSTLVDDDLKMYADDYFNNGQIEVTKVSDGSKQVRTITDFVSSTGTLSVSPNWGSNPDTGYTYIVRRGFKNKIDVAFTEVLQDVCSKGYRPALIMESTALHTPVTKRALALICKDMMKTTEDKWFKLYEIYNAEYRDAMSKVVFQYDADEGGNVSGANEKDQDLGNLRMLR